MCCNTHPLRDSLERAAAERSGPEAVAADAALFTPERGFQCRCAESVEPCQRKMTQEDFLCDWCRVTDHADWWSRNWLPAQASMEPGPRSIVYDEASLMVSPQGLQEAAYGAARGFYEAGKIYGFAPRFEFSPGQKLDLRAWSDAALTGRMDADLPPGSVSAQTVFPRRWGS
jgi:hypothetical protein